MKKQPPFPEMFNGYNICWGIGNNIVGPQLIASIPVFTLYPKESKERKQKEKEYWKQKEKEYNEAKKLYEEKVFIGAVWKGNTNISAKITKIVATNEKQYVCYKASDETIACIAKENKKRKSLLLMKPPKPDRISLSSFLSMIRNGGITIIN